MELFDLLEAAEFASGGHASVCKRQPATDVLLRQQIEMCPKLVVQLGLGPTRREQRQQKWFGSVTRFYLAYDQPTFYTRIGGQLRMALAIGWAGLPHGALIHSISQRSSCQTGGSQRRETQQYGMTLLDRCIGYGKHSKVRIPHP